jgi:hypothetical protein
MPSKRIRHLFLISVGIVLTGDTVRSEQRIAVEDGLVQPPYRLYLLLC